MTEDSLFFFRMIRDFLSLYLPKQRGTSKSTIKSYRDALNLLLDFLCLRLQKPLMEMSFAVMSKNNVLEFLDWLESERNNSVSSRNQRLFAVKSFFKYVAERDRALMSLYLEISSIPKKKELHQHEIEFFSEASLKVILQQPDRKKKNGIRDLVFMILLYDTGARIQEILDIRLGDVHLDEPSPYVTVTGKGSKTRVVPLMQKTCEHLNSYLDRFHHPTADPLELLFYTDRKGIRSQMSADNVEKFIAKYASMAHSVFPEVPGHIYPHMWRHSRAMHLYRNGMPLELVAEWLGHSRIETTRRYYANADATMKKEAIERATSQLSPLRSNDYSLDWQSDEELLRKLYCLG